MSEQGRSSQEEYARRFRERSRRLDEAVKAARSAVYDISGISDISDIRRAEARQRVVAELRARGIVMLPSGVDLIVHDIMLGAGAAGGIRRAAWHLSNAADLAGLAIRSISAVARHQPLPSWDLGGARYLEPDLRVQEDVILDPSAQESLAFGESELPGDVAVMGGDIIEVWLGYPGSGHGPAADGEPLVVYYGEERVGVLGPEASNAYRQAIRQAHDAGVIPVISATRRQADDGSWQLRLGVPLPRPHIDEWRA